MIAIVTDSSAYLTKAQAAQLGVHVVPLNYSLNGVRYTEGYADQFGDFAGIIKNPASTTSQAAPGAFVSLFGELVRRGFQVLCIVISSRLSGTFSSAYIAAKEVSPENIFVVDSLTTAGGLSFLIHKARCLSGEGLSLPALAEAVEAARSSVGIAFSVEDMAPLRKSGRIGLVRQSVSTILNIRPILFCKDGFVTADGFVRGKEEQLRALILMVPKEAKRIIVHHLGCLAQAQTVMTMALKSLPEVEGEIVPLGPVLGVHLGLGTIGIAWSM